MVGLRFESHPRRLALLVVLGVGLASLCNRDHPFCSDSRILSSPKWWAFGSSPTQDASLCSLCSGWDSPLFAIETIHFVATRGYSRRQNGGPSVRVPPKTPRFARCARGGTRTHKPYGGKF